MIGGDFLKKFLCLLLFITLTLFSTQSVIASDLLYTDDFTYTIVNSNGKKEVHITGNRMHTQHIVIPEKIDGYPVTEISQRAFHTPYADYWTEDESTEENTAYQAALIKSITLPSTLKRIHPFAFAYNKLTEVRIPNSVTEIGEMAFAGNQLTKVQLPSMLIQIGASAFSNNQLTTITIPASVKSIGNEAFASNTLTALTIPNTVQSLGPNIALNNPLKTVQLPLALDIKKDKKHGDFYYTIIQNNNKNEVNITGYDTASKKTKLTVPATINKIPVTEIAQYAFAPHLTPSGVTSMDRASLRLKEVILPNSVQKIGAYAFHGTGIKVAKLPTKLVEVSAYAFSGADFNGALTLPASLKKIGEAAFSASNLKGALTIPKSVTTLEKSAFRSNALTKVVIQAPLKVIPAEAFSWNQITSLTLPTTLTTIGASAFYYNQLPRLVLPTNVEVVSMSAFSDNKIKSITMQNKVKTIEPYAFFGNLITEMTIPASVRSFAFSAVENNNQAEKNKLKKVVIQGSKTVIIKSDHSSVFTDAKKTIPFTNWGNVQPKPVTLYVN